MSKRLQVLLDEAEFREIRRAAKTQRMTVAEWVRQSLRASRQRAAGAGAAEKIAAVRRASAHAYPAGEIAAMLEEIERGYLGTPER